MPQPHDNRSDPEIIDFAEAKRGRRPHSLRSFDREKIDRAYGRLPSAPKPSGQGLLDRYGRFVVPVAVVVVVAIVAWFVS